MVWYSIKKIFDKDYLDLEIGDYEQYHHKISTSNLWRINLVSKLVPPGASVLDVGCSTGFNAVFLKKKRNIKYTGFDVSKAAIAKAKKKGLNVFTGDANEFNLKKKFDYVTILETLEHLVNPVGSLLSAKKHAKKGIIVSLPNSGYFTWRLQLLLGIFPRQSFTHLHYWSIRDFEQFCKTLGLTIAGRLFYSDDLGFFKRKLIDLFPNLFAYQMIFLLVPTSTIKETL